MPARRLQLILGVRLVAGLLCLGGLSVAAGVGPTGNDPTSSALQPDDRYEVVRISRPDGTVVTKRVLRNLATASRPSRGTVRHPPGTSQSAETPASLAAASHGIRRGGRVAPGLTPRTSVEPEVASPGRVVNRRVVSRPTDSGVKISHPLTGTRSLSAAEAERMFPGGLTLPSSVLAPAVVAGEDANEWKTGPGWAPANEDDDTGDYTSLTDQFPVLQPGDGWDGPTDEPAPVGQEGDPGWDAKAIARWDVVPYQTITEDFTIGVVAFHINGIDRVEFSVDGGPWVSVREMKLNPRTGVWEYTVVVRPELFAEDGLVEVRAIIWPEGAGEPRALGGALEPGIANGEHSMFLNTNAGGTLPSLVRYVSPTGSDSSGDGTPDSPFRTPLMAARSIQDTQGSNADGGIIYLTAGDHVYGEYDTPLRTITDHRWLTLTAAPGIDRAEVRLTTTTSGEGLRTKLVRLTNVSIVPSTYTRLLSSNSPLEDYLWIESSWFEGRGNEINEKWTNGWSGIFVTATSLGQSRDGISGALVRDMTVRSIGSDAFTNSGLVIDSTVLEIDRGDTWFHPDILQLGAPSGSTRENTIAYGVTSTTFMGQGFFAGADMSIKDIAFIACNLNNQLGSGMHARIFQFGGPTNHMYVRDCEFRGGATWNFEAGFDPHNVVLENTVFHDGGPGSPDGVIVR